MLFLYRQVLEQYYQVLLYYMLSHATLISVHYCLLMGFQNLYKRISLEHRLTLSQVIAQRLRFVTVLSQVKHEGLELMHYPANINFIIIIRFNT